MMEWVICALAVYSASVVICQVMFAFEGHKPDRRDLVVTLIPGVNTLAIIAAAALYFLDMLHKVFRGFRQ